MKKIKNYFTQEVYGQKSGFERVAVVFAIVFAMMIILNMLNAGQ